MSDNEPPRRIDRHTIEDWAQGTLENWLPGYTDYDDVLGCQYRIRRIETDTYEVETVDGAYSAGRFRILVAVVELP